eukprot:8638359-Pyramimonas_sp.AAC.1
MPGSRRKRSSSLKPRSTKPQTRAPVDKPATRPPASVAKPAINATGFTYDAPPHADAPGIEDTSFTGRF